MAAASPSLRTTAAPDAVPLAAARKAAQAARMPPVSAKFSPSVSAPLTERGE